MPLTANFLADFSSFLDATKASIAATEEFETKAAGLGPAVDTSLAQAGTALDANKEKFYQIGQSIGNVLKSQELKNFAGDVKSFASTYIAEFAEAEAATTRLTTALKASGESSPAVAEAYGAMATELQRMSTFSDEAITDAQTLMTTVGNIKPDQMRETLEATMDLAKGMGIDLADAAKLVAKAAATNGEALGKLKVILKDSLEPGTGYAGVMKAINAEFGGQSLAALETTAGQMENLKNQMSDVNELVGQVLAENLKKLLSLFQAMPEGLQTFILAAVGVGTALAPVLVSLSSLVSLLSVTGLGASIMSFFTWLLPYIGPIGWIALGVIGVVTAWKNWDAIVGFITNVYNAVKTWMVDKLTALVDYIVTLPGRVANAFYDMAARVSLFSYVPDMVDGIKSEFRRLDSVMVNPAYAAARDVTAAFADLGATAVPLPTLAAGERPGGGAGGPVTVTINMSGMMGTDDPQTRAMLRDLVSDALMSGMRGSRLMGTA